MRTAKANPADKAVAQNLDQVAAAALALGAGSSPTQQRMAGNQVLGLDTASMAEQVHAFDARRATQNLGNIASITVDVGNNVVSFWNDDDPTLYTLDGKGGIYAEDMTGHRDEQDFANPMPSEGKERAARADTRAEIHMLERGRKFVQNEEGQQESGVLYNLTYPDGQTLPMAYFDKNDAHKLDGLYITGKEALELNRFDDPDAVNSESDLGAPTSNRPPESSSAGGSSPYETAPRQTAPAESAPASSGSRPYQPNQRPTTNRQQPTPFVPQPSPTYRPTSPNGNIIDRRTGAAAQPGFHSQNRWTGQPARMPQWNQRRR